MGPGGPQSHLLKQTLGQGNGKPMIRHIELFKIKYWRHMFSFNSEQWST